MNTMRRSFALLRASRQVIRINPSLMWYPVLALATNLAVIGFIFLPSMLAGIYIRHRLTGWTGEGPSGWEYTVPAILTALALSWVNTFVNSAFYLAADAALQGMKLSTRQTLASAWALRRYITGWALFSATVGMAFNFLSDKVPGFGKLAVWLGETAWTVAVIFAVPVLVTKKVSPTQLVKESAGLIRKTWGEQATSQISLGLFLAVAWIFLLILPSLVLLARFFDGSISLLTAVDFGALFLILGLAATTYFIALQTIFNAALFRYAETGDYIGPFSAELVNGAFRSKSKKVSR